MSILLIGIVSCEIQQVDKAKKKNKRSLILIKCREKLQPTIALGDVVEFENRLPGTAAWLCIEDKYNLPMFSDVCQAETKAQ